MLAFGVVFVLLTRRDRPLDRVPERHRRRRRAPSCRSRTAVTSCPGSGRSCWRWLVATLIGAFQGSFVAIIGVPAFVVTLAGLLAWQGVIQVSVGAGGPIIIENRWINYTESYFFSKDAGWMIGVPAQRRLRRRGRSSGSSGKRRHGVRDPQSVPRHSEDRRHSRRDRVRSSWRSATTTAGCPLAGLMIIFFLLFWTLRREANDVRPPRVRGGRQRRGCAARRHQRRRASGSWSSGSPGSWPACGGILLAAQRQVGRSGSGRRHVAARRDLGRRHRRHEPVRRPRLHPAAPCSARR